MEIAEMTVDRYDDVLELMLANSRLSNDNDLANEYWLRRGWTKRCDIKRYSFNRSSDPNS
jgi:hypothetical protein